MRAIRLAAAAAVAMLAAQPCLAADDFRGLGAGERQSAAFAGMRLRLPMGSANSERPSARLQLTTFHDYRDAAGAMVRSHRSPGMELGLDRFGRTSFQMAGQDMAQAQQRLGVSGSTRTALIIGGVVVVVLLLAAVTSTVPGPGPDEGAFD